MRLDPDPREARGVAQSPAPSHTLHFLVGGLVVVLGLFLYLVLRDEGASFGGKPLPQIPGAAKAEDQQAQ